MALAALIGAYQEVSDGDALRATLPVAGHLLVEHQARQAAKAGARNIILLVERVPAPLAAAVDRLRRSGLTVEVARTVADAADRVHPEERLLVMGDGIVADQRIVERMAAASAPAVLALPDEPRHQSLERIDAASRWGGLILTDGSRLRRTVAMLGEWDLLSTLLRQTLQDRASPVDAPGGIALVEDPAALEGVRETLVEATRRHATSWTERFLFAPVEELAVPPLLRIGVDPLWVSAAAIALSILATVGVALGQLRMAFLALLISLPVAAVARRIGRLRLDAPARLRLRDRTQAGTRVVALPAFAWAIAAKDGWGAWVLAGALAVVLAALAVERVLAAARAFVTQVSQWLADDEAVVLVAAPFALTGHWIAALAVPAIYAAASLLALQARELRAVRRTDGAV